MKKKLNPKLKVYVEYSNETWNTIFDQAKYCKEKGMAMRLSNNEYEAQLRYSAQRSLEIFKIFEKEFGGKDRLVRVLCRSRCEPVDRDHDHGLEGRVERRRRHRDRPVLRQRLRRPEDRGQGRRHERGRAPRRLQEDDRRQQDEERDLRGRGQEARD